MLRLRPSSLLLVLGLLWLGGLAWAAGSKDKPKPRPQAVSILSPEARDASASQVELKAVEYRHPAGAERGAFVFQHGFAAGSAAWNELGDRMYALGYDVVMPNLGGHGGGEHRSRRNVSRVEDLGFRGGVLYDAPAIVEHAFARNGGKPIVLVAHSMGALIFEEYLKGTYERPDGSLARSDELARQRGRMVKGFVSIGAPPSFRDIPLGDLEVDVFGKKLSLVGAVRAAFPAWKHLAQRVWLPGKIATPTEAPPPPGLLGRARDRVLSVVTPIAKKLVPEGILNGANLSDREFTRMWQKVVTAAPDPLIYDGLWWAEQGEMVDHAKRFNYGDPAPIYAPVLFVAAEKDVLAPPALVWAKAGKYAGLAEVRTLLLEGSGHNDAVTGARSAQMLEPALVAMDQDPTRIGPPIGSLAESLQGPQTMLRCDFWNAYQALVITLRRPPAR